MGLRNFVNRRAPIDRQEVPGPHGSALLEDIFCDVRWRASDELVIAEREPAGWRRCVGHIYIHAFVLGYEAL